VGQVGAFLVPTSTYIEQIDVVYYFYFTLFSKPEIGFWEICFLKTVEFKRNLIKLNIVKADAADE